MAEQSKRPEKTNATVKEHLNMVPGLGTGGLLLAYREPFASPGDRVFVELREVKRDLMSGGGTEVLVVIYREDGMRQVFVEDFLENLVDLDRGVTLRDGPIRPLDDKQGDVVPTATRRLESMDFSDALKHVKEGRRVQRSKWNGKGMYLEMVDNGRFQRPYKSYEVEPFVVMFTAQGTWVPWTCSQADLLAEDWEVVES